MSIFNNSLKLDLEYNQLVVVSFFGLFFGKKRGVFFLIKFVHIQELITGLLVCIVGIYAGVSPLHPFKNTKPLERVTLSAITARDPSCSPAEIPGQLL